MGKRNAEKTSKAPTGSATPSPSSPSSAAHSTPVSVPVPVPPFSGKLLKRFYEPLVLQHVLGNTRGSHISVQPPDGQDESELDNCKLRRSFIDMLAYICDYQKGGSTVTAIALEETPAAVVFWVAANKNVSQKVVPFLTAILKNLARHSLHGATPDSEEFAMAVEDTFKRAVEFGAHRVKKYWRFMQESLEKCVTVLDRSNSDQGELQPPHHGDG